MELNKEEPIHQQIVPSLDPLEPISPNGLTVGPTGPTK